MSRPRASNHGAAPLKYQEPQNTRAATPLGSATRSTNDDGYGGRVPAIPAGLSREKYVARLSLKSDQTILSGEEPPNHPQRRRAAGRLDGLFVALQAEAEERRFTASENL